MTLPQQSSTDPVLAGGDLFRLLTPLGSAGDIYALQTSALAFALGPDSDFSNVLITYLDPNNTTADPSIGQQPSQVSQLVISTDRSMIGRINALNSTTYPSPGTRRGRILLSIKDVYSRLWRPLGFNDANDRIRFVEPIIDVLQYFSAPSSLIPQRSDKTYRFQYFIQPANAASTWIVVPSYGRKSGSMSFKNSDPAETINVTVYGVQMSLSGAVAGQGPNGSYQKTIKTTSAVLPNSSTDFVFSAATQGVYDCIAIELQDYRGNAMPVTITLSDDV